MTKPMKALSDLIQELRELDKAATPGDWVWDAISLNSMAKKEKQYLKVTWHSGIRTYDKQLIARYRNAMSTLLDVIEAQAESLRLWQAAYPEDMHECFVTGPMTGDETEDMKICPHCRAVESQAKIEALIKESEGE